MKISTFGEAYTLMSRLQELVEARTLVGGFANEKLAITIGNTNHIQVRAGALLVAIDEQIALCQKALVKLGVEL